MKDLFYEPKHAKKKNDDNDIYKMLMPSLIIIFLCVAGLIGMTWAWFTAGVEGKNQYISASNYFVSVHVTDSLDETLTQSALNEYSLLPGVQYSVTLTQRGDASTGYCVVMLGNRLYYTDSILNGEQLTFNVKNDTAEPVVMDINAVWGTYIGGYDILNGDSVVYAYNRAAEVSNIESDVSHAESNVQSAPESFNESSAPDALVSAVESTVSSESTAPSESTVPPESTNMASNTSSNINP